MRSDSLNSSLDFLSKILQTKVLSAIFGWDMDSVPVACKKAGGRDP